MMANWSSMELAAQSWIPCDFQMAADWTLEPAAQVWVPGLPVEYQTSGILATSGQQQLVAAYAGAAIEVGHTIIHEEVAVKIHDVYKETAQAFDSDIKNMGVNMHRYPTSLHPYFRNKRYCIPSTVAIGPYHHGLPHLQEAEKVKHAAASHCIEQSGHSIQDMYDAVVLDTDYARSLYDKNVVVGISDNDFQPMMFHDACFLVQWMLSCTHDGYSNMDKSLRNYFDANSEAILNDVMMLENQLPWQVVEILMKFRDVPLNLKDVAKYARGYLHGGMDLKNSKKVVYNASYKPPHLLGFLRFYMVGRRSDTKQLSLPETISISSFGAIELAEMGIEVKVSKARRLMGRGLEEGQHNFFLPQVSLDDSRVCILINMAAFELCTIPKFLDPNVKEEDSAVCSYLQLLAMMMDKKEDVQELRRKHVLQGGGGLTDEQVLEFFSCIQGLRPGSHYIRTMVGIENYKRENKLRVLCKSFIYNYMKTIVIVLKLLGAIGAVAGIIGTFVTLKKSN